MLRPKYRYVDMKYELSQRELEDPNGCVFVAGLTAIANNHGITFSEEVIKNILEQRPRSIGKTGSNPQLVLPKLAAIVSSLTGVTLTVVRRNILSGMTELELRRGWMALIHGDISTGYIQDIKDGKLDGVRSLNGGTFGHMRCLHYMSGKHHITETAYGNLPFNTFPVSNIKELVQAGRIKRTCYFIK